MWSSIRSLALAALAALGSLACEPPPSFAEVELDDARRLLREPDVAVVDAVGGARHSLRVLPGAVRWTLTQSPATPPDEIPSGPVLVVGASRPVGHRSAAALARAGNHPVYMFIPRDADERSSLYALALQSEETTRGEDS